MPKTEYNELAKAEIQEGRNLVISECSAGGFTIAQRIDVKETNNHIMSVYLKGAFHIEDVHGLYNLRDALNVAIEKSEKK